MNETAKISPPEPERRLPNPRLGININYCRNPLCDLFTDPPDPYVRKGRPSEKVERNQTLGEVIGSNNDKTFKCGACGQSSIIKNNSAIVEEYWRIRRRFRPSAPRDACSKTGCENHGKSRDLFPDLYRKSGRTAKGAQRWKCKACLASFSVGSRIRRQHRSSANREVLWMLTNGLPISKIADFTELCPRDVYRKIDFIYDCVADLTARREALFEKVDWMTVGRRFVSDSQTLKLNWPNKKTRAQIPAHHLCTAHANSGYIMASHLSLDPDVDLPDIEERMLADRDFGLPRAFRKQARVWSETEFKEHLDRMTEEVEIHPLEAPEVDFGLQLPHKGALMRQDIMQVAHAFLVRRCLGKGDERFVFVLDADPGLAFSFVSAFAGWIKEGRADVAVVQFDKNKFNDQRNMLVGDGRAALASATGLSRSALDSLTGRRRIEETDAVIEKMLSGHIPGTPFSWPFHTKSEPNRRIRLPTDRVGMAPDRRARLMRLSTLRSVDAYFHKVRSNVRFASRPAHTPSSNDRAWDQHYLYNPETMVKVIEIYRFVHNWMGLSKTQQTPAMKMGLARGKIRASEFFA